MSGRDQPSRNSTFVNPDVEGFGLGSGGTPSGAPHISRGLSLEIWVFFVLKKTLKIPKNNNGIYPPGKSSILWATILLE
jgi:hypothetical protein